MEQRMAFQSLWLIVFLMVSLPTSEARKTICIRQSSMTRVNIVGGMAAGIYKNLGKTTSIEECLNKACDSQQGNIAFLLRDSCFSLRCNDPQSQACKMTLGGKLSAGANYQVIDAYPVFKNVRDVIYVDENTPVGTKVFKLEAVAESRKKERETMDFEIIAGNIGKAFHLYPASSSFRVSIQTLKLLDREKTPSYRLTIKGTNRVENVSSSVNIAVNVTDVNDNPPRFVKSLFVFNVFSNMSRMTVLGKLVAEDNDTKRTSVLKYDLITPSLMPDLIILDRETGEVKLNKKRQVDTVKSYKYQITVTDGIYTSKGRMNIEVYPNNINRPTFVKKSYTVHLNGQVPIGSEVVRVSAEDPDFGKLGELTFLITKGNEDDNFRITNEGEIQTTGTIPSRREVYNLTVDVHDNGYPQLSAVKPVNVVISVQWVRFKQAVYDTTVPEDQPIFAKIYTVSASIWVGGHQLMAAQVKQKNYAINYYLADGPGSSDIFQLDENTGAITLTKPLDYERRKFYKLEINAECESYRDSSPRTTSLTAKAILRLNVTDVNDNAPRFSSLYYSQDVWRSSKENSPVLKINATDPDEGLNGRIRFIPETGNINNTFSFHHDGFVFLRKSLVETSISTFNITIAAWDSGTPKRRSADTALVTIHVRGYSGPRVLVFHEDSYSAMISESIPIDTRIVQVKASVFKRRSMIKYSILQQNIPFRVEPRTGWIRNTKKLDREKKNVYIFTTMAKTDIGRTSLTTTVNVTITLEDENDNRPRFMQEYYSTVMTAHGIGTTVLRITATDDDLGRNAMVAYRISGGDDKKYFSINSRTGQVRTTATLPTTSLEVLKFSVSARDEGRPPLSALNDVPVFVFVGSTFPIKVESLSRTTTEMKLRFTMTNVTLKDVTYIGVVVQELIHIAGYDKITKRPLVSWFHIHNGKSNGLYAQRYLTGKVQCTDLIRQTKTFDFTVGSDGEKCNMDKGLFCNGKLQAEKTYRFQLVAYFENGTSLKNFTSIESEISETIRTDVNNAKQVAGFRSWRYDIIVIVLGVIVGVIIAATVTRAIMLYRRDRLKKEEAKDEISYPLSNPRYRRSGEHSHSSRSTISFTELNKSRKTDKRSEKTSPHETDDEQEEASDKEVETELNT